MVALLFLLMQVVPAGDVGGDKETPAMSQATFSDQMNFDSLYRYAATLLVKFNAEKESARKVFIASGEPAIEYLVEEFDTKSASEMSALEEMLKRMGMPAINGILSSIDYRGSDDESRALRLSLRIISETFKYDSTLTGDDVAPKIARFTQDADWRVRGAAATALGYSRSRKALPHLVAAAGDSIGLVRKSAAYGIRNLARPEDIPVLLKLLADEFYGVRHAASDGLVEIGRPAIDSIAMQLRNAADPAVRSLLIMTLARIKDSRSQKVIRTCLTDTSPVVRMAVYESIADPGILAKCLRRETNPLLKSYLVTRNGP